VLQILTATAAGMVPSGTMRGKTSLERAGAVEIEACRVEPDPHGVEDRLVLRLQAAGETLIAFAVTQS